MSPEGGGIIGGAEDEMGEKLKKIEKWGRSWFWVGKNCKKNPNKPEGISVGLFCKLFFNFCPKANLMKLIFRKVSFGFL